MKNTHLLTVAAHIVISLTIYSNAEAQATSTKANSGEESTCRVVITAGVKKEQVYCGTEKQWAEFDRRVKLINAGVTCRWARTPRELCMNSKQWKEYDRRQREYYQEQGRSMAIRASTEATSRAMEFSSSVNSAGMKHPQE